MENGKENPPKKTRISYACRTPKNLGKEGKTLKFAPTKAPTKRPPKASTEVPRKVSSQVLRFTCPSGRAQRDGSKVTERAQNTDFRRKPQIFADSPPLLLEIPAFGGRRKPQKTADFRRKTAGNCRLGSVTLGASPLASVRRPFFQIFSRPSGLGRHFSDFFGVSGPEGPRDPCPEGPARHLDASRQKLTPHCLAAIFDSQLPSPKLSLRMPPKLPLSPQ